MAYDLEEAMKLFDLRAVVDLKGTKRFIEGLKSRAELLSVRPEVRSADGANELLLIAEPSDCLLEFVTAPLGGASERNNLAVERV